MKFKIGEKLKGLKGRKEGWKELRFYAAKGFLIFLAVMFLFTIISRSAAALTVAQVSVESPYSQAIEHTVIAGGMVEKNRELAVVTMPGILVETVYTEIGEKVLEGDVLAKLDMESLREQISGIEDEIRLLQLQTKAAEENKEAAAERSHMDAERAKEDYDRAVNEQQEAVARAAEALQKAQEDYDSFTEYYNQNYPAENETAPDGSSREQFDQILTERKAAFEAAYDVYDEVWKQQEEAVRAAARKLEDTKISGANDYTSQMNGIRITSKEEELKKLRELEEKEGEIKAVSEGVITAVSLTTGQKTTDTAAFTIADLSSGMRYKAVIEKENIIHVSMGDPVVLENKGKEISDLKVDAMELLEDGKMEITVFLSYGELSIGDAATARIRKVTEKYPLVVPLTSLRKEKGNSYLLVLDTIETVLGEQYAARKVYVTVNDKNSEYAAVSSGELTQSSQVITDSDRYVEAGSTVRLRES